MKKEINIKYLDKIEQAIAEAEGKASARTISAKIIIGSLDRVEKNLSIPKKYMDGIEVDIDHHADTFPNAYNGTPMSTQFKAVYKNGSWRVTEIERRRTRSGNKRYIVKLTDDAKRAILAKHEMFDY